MKRLVIPLAIILIIALIGGMGYLGFRSAQPTSSAAPQIIPQTVAVSRGEVDRTVTAPGRLIGLKEETLSMEVGGRLEKLNVRPGDKVRAGQVLAALDTVDLELAVAQAEQTYLKAQAAYSATVQPDPQAVAAAQAAVSTAYAEYQAAKRQFDLRGDQLTVTCLDFKNASDELARAQAAFDSVANDWKARNYQIYFDRKEMLAAAQGAYQLARANCNLNTTSLNDIAMQSTLVQLNQARANLDKLIAPGASTLLEAKTRLEQARLPLEKARQQLAGATLSAPFDGIVLQVNANLGESVAAHTNLIVLSNPTVVEVQSTVIEEDMALVQIGQGVKLFFDANPDASATGRVTRRVPRRTSGDRLLYPIYIAIDQLPQGLVAGMTVDASVVVATRSGVLRLPRELVRVRADDTAQIRVWTGDRIEPRTIKVGLRGGTFVEVLAGLREGEQVVSE